MKRIPAFVCLLALAFSCGEKPETPSQETTKPVTFTVQPTSVEFTAAGGSQSLVLTTDSKSWKATVTDDWVTVSPASGSGSKTLTVTVPANDGERRMVTVSFSDASGAKGSAIVSVTQEGSSGSGSITPSPAAFDGNKRASTTYQLLIYTFADSDGDGVGDFKGIQDKLDYLDGLGVTALWLSPAHPTSSYHGYDVDDYYTVNPLFGTEQDFKNLIDAAHAKGIKIYMDYVLNHSGKNNPWFTQALSDPSSKYRDYYFISSNPASDYSKFPMLANTSY
ncbi:MAG: alpha-amylase, partial [Bacteroidales bacterium]|nr:alpha-amylase [Bacteroidales bacterium]